MEDCEKEYIEPASAKESGDDEEEEQYGQMVLDENIDESPEQL